MYFLPLALDVAPLSLKIPLHLCIHYLRPSIFYDFWEELHATVSR